MGRKTMTEAVCRKNDDILWEPLTRTHAHRSHLGGFNGDLGDVSPDRGLGVGPVLCVHKEGKVVDMVGTGVTTAAERT